MAGDSTQVQVRDTYERVFGPGDVIFNDGDPGEVLFVIQSGEVEISRHGLSGRRAVARLVAGEFLNHKRGHAQTMNQGPP